MADKNAPKSTPKNASIRFILVFGVIVIGAFLRFRELNQLSFWIDETLTYRYASLSFRDLFFQILDIHPPVYYIFLKLWMMLFGSGEYAIRSLSAVIGTASVYLIFTLGRKLGGFYTGLIAASLLATSAIHIQYSQEARSYAMLIFGALLAVLGVIEIMDEKYALKNSDASPENFKKTPVNWLNYGFYISGITLVLYSHNTGALLLFVLNIVIFKFWIQKLDYDRRFAIQWATVNIIVLLLWSWWLPIILHQIGNEMTGFWLVKPSLLIGIQTARTIVGQKYILTIPFQPFIDLFFIGLILLGGSLTYRGRMILSIAIVVPLLSFLISQYFPIFMERTIILVASLFITISAVGIASLRSISRPLPIFIIIIAILVQSIGVRNYYYNYKKEDWRSLVTTINSSGKQTDLILFCGIAAHIAYSFYADRMGMTNTTLDIAVDQPLPIQAYLINPPVGSVDVVRPENLHSLVSGFDTVWLVRSRCYGIMPEDNLLETLKRSHRFIESRPFIENENFKYLFLDRFERTVSNHIWDNEG